MINFVKSIIVLPITFLSRAKSCLTFAAKKKLTMLEKVAAKCESLYPAKFLKARSIILSKINSAKTTAHDQAGLYIQLAKSYRQEKTEEAMILSLHYLSKARKQISDTSEAVENSPLISMYWTEVRDLWTQEESKILLTSSEQREVRVAEANLKLETMIST